MENNWDKRLTKVLIEHGLSWDHARIAVGIIAEQRQIADRQGYERGYNDGYARSTNDKLFSQINPSEVA